VKKWFSLWYIGSFHYFRSLPELWKDRLLKMKAGGLNTVEVHLLWILIPFFSSFEWCQCFFQWHGSIHSIFWSFLFFFSFCSFVCVFVYQTYIPWNLHQPRNEPVYNFEGRLDVVRFVKLAQEVGLFVIIRGPPYICAGFSLSLSLSFIIILLKYTTLKNYLITLLISISIKLNRKLTYSHHNEMKMINKVWERK
jgi:hypothetical protein